MSNKEAIQLQDHCLRVVHKNKLYPLSLVPSGFFPERSLCICSYPNCNYFDFHTTKRVDIFEGEVSIHYEKVIATGIFYQKPYKHTKLVLKDLYKTCKDLDDIIGFLESIKPRINLLTALVYCMKVSSEDWIYDILGEALSIILKREIGSDILSNSLVTFVPRHERDMKEDRFKGIKFNQAELLAKSLANKLGLRVNNLIEKLEPTQRSPEDRVARYQRVQRIYSLKPEALGIIRGINVILVDDVRTTGATSTYISGLLHSNGAASVYVAVAGRSVFNEDYNDFYNIELEKCSMIASD